MWKLVGGKMVWVPMAEAGNEGSDGGGGSGGDEAGNEGDGSGAGADEASGLPPDLDDWMTPDARAAFEYDPFAPKEEEAGEGDKGKSTEGGDEGAAAGGKTEGESAGRETQEEPEKNKEGAQSEEKERIAQLEKQLADYQEMMHKQLLNQAEKGSGEKEGEGAEGEDSDPLEKIPDYKPFRIPDAIKEKIFSEKPEDMMDGLGMLMQGVAQITHYNVRKEMAQLMDQRMDNKVNKAQSELTEKQEAKQTQASIRKDWEKAYPDLAEKDLQPLVAHIGQQVVQETGAKEWNEELRDKIAARVRKVLGRNESGEGSGEKEGEAGKSNGSANKPPFAAKGSARQGAPRKPDPTAQEISETLGLG